MENAIRALGHELIKFEDRDHVFPGRLRNKVKFFYNLDLKIINKNLLSLAVEKNPDIVIISGGNRIRANTIRKLKENGIITVLWTTDPPILFKPILETAGSYDYVFCQGTEAVEILAGAGIKYAKWLPMACDPQLHRPIELSDEDRANFGRDVAFVGSYYANRWNVLRKLSEFNLGIWGPGWSKIDIDPDFSGSVTDTKLEYKIWQKIFCAAKIVIVIHYQDGVTPCYQISPKVFEALACKGFVLIDQQRDVFKLFKNGTHLVSFEDTEDLKNKIRYYLINQKQRATIAQNGFGEVKSRNTYVDRLKTLFNELKMDGPQA